MNDLYSRLHALSKILESSGVIDERQHPDAYLAILDAMKFVQAEPAPVVGAPSDEQIMQRVLDAKALFEPWAIGQGYNLAREDRGYMATYRDPKSEHAWRGYCTAVMALRSQ